MASEDENIKFQSELLDDVDAPSGGGNSLVPLYAVFRQDSSYSLMRHQRRALVKNYQGFNAFTPTSSRTVKHRFSELPDEFRRFLTPTVKIYKTFINEDDEEITLRILTDPNRNGVDRVDLESVDFVRLGGNPAEVDTNIDFNISLSAREINFFFKKQFPRSEEGMSGLWATEMEAKGVAWIDLIKIDPGQELQANSQRVVNETDSRIKVVLGYAMPSSPPRDMDENYWSTWREVILSQSEAFYLNLKKHTFNFKESGDVTLSVNFCASSEARLLSPGADIITDPYLKEIVKRKQSILKRLTREQRTVTSWNELRENENIEELSERMREALSAEIIELLGGLPNDEVSDLTIGAIENCVASLQREIDSTTEDIEGYTTWCKARMLNQIYLTAGDYQDGAYSRYGSFTRVLRRGMLSQEEADRGDTTRRQYDVFQKVAGVTTGQMALQGVRDADLARYGGEAESEVSDPEHIDVKHYTTLGDIIEAAMEIIADSSRLGDTPKDVEFSSYTRRGTTSYHYILPFGVMGINESRRISYANKFGIIMLPKFRYNKPSDVTKKIQIDLGDLPISLDLFRSWWINKTSNSRTLYFKDFMSSLLNDFVKNHVFSQAIYNELDVEDVEFPSFIMNSVLLPYEDVLQAVTTGRLPISKQAWAHVGLSNDVENVENPLSPKMSVLAVQRADDPRVATEEEPRLIWGQSTRGVLESIEFNREDIPGFAESRLFSEDDGMANNMMLREKYNVNITLLGTTMLMPGSFFRLDPQPLDLGFEDEGEDSLARALGLGGRYCCHSIEHQIDLVSKKWETNITGKWVSFSDGTDGTSAQVPSLTLSDDSCLISGINRYASDRQSEIQSEIDELRRRRVQLRVDKGLFEENYSEERLESVYSYQGVVSELSRTDDVLESLQQEQRSLDEYIIPEEPEESQ